MDGRPDTNIVIALLGGDLHVQRRIDAIPEILVSPVVLGELSYGAAHSARPQQNAAAVEGFAGTCTVVQIDMETARMYGLIKAELRRKGRPIPENDLWIAASARQHDLLLMTRDPHFKRVEGLGIESWR
jgi:tRNA(fMet)-specific endonuclease VapC